MYAQKWNWKTKKYEEYKLPEGVIFFSKDLDKETACAQCGDMKKFGECFTSREVHTQIGLGFSVCKDCYKEEWDRDQKERK